MPQKAKTTSKYIVTLAVYRATTLTTSKLKLGLTYDQIHTKLLKAFSAQVLKQKYANSDFRWTVQKVDDPNYISLKLVEVHWEMVVAFFKIELGRAKVIIFD